MKRRSLSSLAQDIKARLQKRGIELTIGGEPSYVPVEPNGPEWYITAVGSTKLGYAHALADALIREVVPGAVAFYSPGKSYPGEANPRWAVNLVWNRNRSPLVRPPRRIVRSSNRATLKVFRQSLAAKLRVPPRWLRALDPADPKRPVWALPLDYDGKNWVTDRWPFGKTVTLLPADGPAGLRLPLNTLPPEALRRVLVVEVTKDGRIHIFLPPLLQKPFTRLLKAVTSALEAAGATAPVFEGYVPADEADVWSKLSLTPDPGVLEINLPPCTSAAEYAEWMDQLEKATISVGLRSFKQPSPEVTLGTGGGNHILFGGPSLARNGFFTHPAWVTSILRYWQHHPSLSYLFTGDYVGSSSQAPRPDESARELYDLEMAYRFLEQLPAGQDHRALTSETLRHLHTDGSGNTHRSEISFDKFWNAAWDGGCRGLIEFRAIETMPRAEWMSAVTLLWQALAAWLFEKPFTASLIDYSTQLHDRYFLPTPLWQDLSLVMRDLQRAGFELPEETYRAIWEWRFPAMLAVKEGFATLSVRKAHEGWPLLCETPLEGGNTSRFVDTSMERLEFVANRAFAGTHRIFVLGRELKLEKFPGGQIGAGLRYRRTALYPSLHPGIQPQMPLLVAFHCSRGMQRVFKLEENRRLFQPTDEAPPAISKVPCKKLRPHLLTSDLRLP